MDLKQALHKALSFEQKGQKIYAGIASESKHPMVKKVFSYLADMELEHVQDIKGFMVNKGIELKGDEPEETEEFFTTTMKKFKSKAHLSQTDIKAYEAALDLERHSYRFYKEHFDSAEDEEAKKFFGFMMEQESAHYTLISRSYDFLRDPAHFYMHEEGWIFEG